LVTITFAYNIQTGQQVSLDALFSSSRISPDQIHWSPDGNYLALETDETRGTANIIAFNNNNNNWSFNIIDSASSQEQVLINWLGAGDLLLTGKNDEANRDSVRYIAQIINGVWYSTEFFRFSSATFERTGQSDWYITASDQEKQALTCLFDQAQPTRLAIGTRARVNFTNGMPLRLRAAPSLDAAEIQQMPEGTEFDVIGGPACANGAAYNRFWQVRLDDGTTGWAAEADQTSYFIEAQ
jgi:SH3 domain-containing protein